jgi:hypothetical protein
MNEPSSTSGGLRVWKQADNLRSRRQTSEAHPREKEEEEVNEWWTIVIICISGQPSAPNFPNDSRQEIGSAITVD